MANGAGGRPRKPTQLHKLHGTYRRDRQNAAEPAPPLGGGKPPAWLKGRARKGWREIASVLEAVKILTEMDRPALALLCDAYGEYIEARETVRRAGATYEASSVAGGTLIRPHPAVVQASDAWRRCAAMLGQFGMTPASRAKVSAAGESERDPLAEWLAGSGSG